MDIILQIFKIKQHTYLLYIIECHMFQVLYLPKANLYEIVVIYFTTLRHLTTF